MSKIYCVYKVYCVSENPIFTYSLILVMNFAQVLRDQKEKIGATGNAISNSLFFILDGKKSSPGKTRDG